MRSRSRSWGRGEGEASSSAGVFERREVRISEADPEVCFFTYYPAPGATIRNTKRRTKKCRPRGSRVVSTPLSAETAAVALTGLILASAPNLVGAVSSSVAEAATAVVGAGPLYLAYQKILLPLLNLINVTLPSLSGVTMIFMVWHVKG